MTPPDAPTKGPPQRVRRPPTAVPGAPGPWESLPAAARRGISVASVEAALGRAGRSGPPPAPAPGPGPSGPTPAPSAVLVALFEEAGEARTVLTRRSSGLRAHAGEVSFPGGRIDPGESPLEAARREAAEEVGLDPAAVRPAGWLRPLATFSSMSLIVPVVAVLDRRPSLSANEAEVARVFDVALADLVAEGAFSEERWTVPGRVVEGAGDDTGDGSFPVWFFEVATETVWGATARILFELVSLVLGVTSEG